LLQPFLGPVARGAHTHIHTRTQGESSTGTHQSLAGLSEICKQTNTLLLVDTVCSLGGVPLFADAWGVDAIYSGSQKCLSGPPGAAPLFFSQKAMDKLQRRKNVPATYNLDMNLVGGCNPLKLEAARVALLHWV